jgi:hypothetical protein
MPKILDPRSSIEAPGLSPSQDRVFSPRTDRPKVTFPICVLPRWIANWTPQPPRADLWDRTQLLSPLVPFVALPTSVDPPPAVVFVSVSLPLAADPMDWSVQTWEEWTMSSIGECYDLADRLPADIKDDPEEDFEDSEPMEVDDLSSPMEIDDFLSPMEIDEFPSPMEIDDFSLLRPSAPVQPPFVSVSNASCQGFGIGNQFALMSRQPATVAMTARATVRQAPAPAPASAPTQQTPTQPLPTASGPSRLLNIWLEKQKAEEKKQKADIAGAPTPMLMPTASLEEASRHPLPDDDDSYLDDSD